MSPERWRPDSRSPRGRRSPRARSWARVAGVIRAPPHNAPMPLLYVDLLGMKSRYRARGVNAARAGQRQLRAVVLAGLSALPAGVEVSGGVQSDAAALQFLCAPDA